jgi:hypothetical protein
MGTAAQYSLYVFCIILGCVVSVLIAYAIWIAAHGIEDIEPREFASEQKEYMRRVRMRNINTLALNAGRPDLCTPVE